MKSYYFIYDAFSYVNSIILLISSVLSIIVLKRTTCEIIKIVAFYLLFCCLFDLLSRSIVLFFHQYIPHDYTNIFLRITFRLGELLIIGYLINKYWLKSKIAWGLMVICSSFLIYDLFTYQSKGIRNYEAQAQTAATILLIGLIITNLLKQLNSSNEYNFTNQMLNMVFLAYFSINLIYTVIQNFIINQSFTNKSFVIFYSSYALLHITYYFALAFILFKNKNKVVSYN